MPATPPAVARVSDSAPTRVAETHPCRPSAPRTLRGACSHRVPCRLLRLLPREARPGRDGGSAPHGRDARRALRARLAARLYLDVCLHDRLARRHALTGHVEVDAHRVTSEDMLP